MTKSLTARRQPAFRKLVVQPGYGSEQLHLGQNEREVRDLLGAPDSITRKFEGQYFYNYHPLGIQLDFGKRGGRVRYIYFFRGGVRNYRRAKMATSDALSVGDRRSKVLSRRGRPDQKGEAFVLNWGEFSGEWMTYDDGINFQFGRDHKVDMIAIARQKSARKRQSLA